MGVHVHNAIQGVDGLTELLQENIANLVEGGVVSLAPGESIANFPVETRAQDFDLMEKKIYELMRQIIGITSQGTGEELPASTTATQIQDNRMVANTVFDFVRERVHHGIKRLFNEGYKEDIVDEIDENELVAITGDVTALRELDNILVENSANKWAEEYKKTWGIYPSKEEYEIAKKTMIDNLEEMGDTRYPALKKQLLKDMEYMISFEMTQEAFDSKARFEALIAMKNDPNSTKSKAKIEDEILNLQGLNPRAYDLSPEEKEQRAMAEQQAMMEEQGQQQTAEQQLKPVV
jgi:hypothetical protein